MKIKTVVDNIANNFDERVNAALEEGYMLARRISDQPGPFIAELVMLDPEPDPETPDILEAVQAVKSACLAHEGSCDDCPANDWCERLALGGDPTDWEVPEE